MRSRFIFLLLFTFSFTARADWPQFRGPNGNGFAEGNENLPTELSKNTITWQIPLPGRGLGSPLIIGDKIFLSAASGPEQDQLHVFCFSAADGAKVWERRFWATGRTMCHKKTCVAAPTPASDGKRIYVLYSSNDFFCLDLEGNLLWMRGLTLDYPNASNSLGMASSPVVAGDTVVAQIENDSESFAAGFDPITGTNKWKIDRPKAANWSSPVKMKTDGQLVVALQSTKGVLGVLPETGSEIFNFDKGASATPSSASSGETLYIPSSGLTAIRPGAAGGEPEQLWNETAQRPGTASPLIIGDKVYVINGAGVLNCAALASGERLWRIRLKPPISSSPVAAGNHHLYAFSENGIGQCVDLRGEEGKVVSEIELGETILSTAAIANDALYIRSDKHLWKFSKN